MIQQSITKPWPKAGEAPDLAIPALTRRALFMCAAHCQGGNGLAGAAAAEALGIPHPVRMEPLVAKAREEGFDPTELWPWLVDMHWQLFTRSERRSFEARRRHANGAA